MVNVIATMLAIVVIFLMCLGWIITHNQEQLIKEIKKLSTKQQVEDMMSVFKNHTASMIRDRATGLLNKSAFDIFSKQYISIQGLYFMVIESDAFQKDKVIREATNKSDYIMSKIGIELLKLNNNNAANIVDVYRIKEDQFLIVSTEDLNAIAVIKDIKSKLSEYKIDTQIYFTIGKYHRVSTNNPIHRCVSLARIDLEKTKAKMNNH